MAGENPTWGYRRIHGELVGLGQRIAPSTIWQILRTAGSEPAPQRSAMTWSQFLRSQATVACDFATIDTVTLRRFYLLFFIDITTRTVYFGGITEHPTGAWTTQAARNLYLRHGDQLAGARALLRDRGSQFIDAFDEIFRTEGLKVFPTPIRAPVANAFAERWIGTLRRELLDRTLIWNERQLERLAADYIDHYNQHRPHRSLDQRPPAGTVSITSPAQPDQLVKHTLRRPRQRVPTRRLTSHDRVTGTHRHPHRTTRRPTPREGSRRVTPPARPDPQVLTIPLLRGLRTRGDHEASAAFQPLSALWVPESTRSDGLINEYRHAA